MEREKEDLRVADFQEIRTTLLRFYLRKPELLRVNQNNKKPLIVWRNSTLHNNNSQWLNKCNAITTPVKQKSLLAPVVNVMPTTIEQFKSHAGVWTIVAYCVGVFLFNFEGKLPENLWLIVTYSCFAASAVLGILAARQGKMWLLFFAILSVVFIIATVIGIA